MKRFLSIVLFTFAMAAPVASQEVALRRSVDNDRRVGRIAFSPDGKTLAAGCGKSVKLFDVATGKNLAALEGHTSGISALVFSPDGKILASGGRDDDRGEVRLWDVATGRNTAVYKLSRQQAALSGGPMEAAHALVFTADSKTLISGSGDSEHAEIKFWDVANARNTSTIRTTDGVYFSFAPSRDGKRLASADFDDNVKLWDLDTKKCIATFNGHASFVYSVAFSPDGKTLASGSGDKTIRLWDVASGKNTATLKGHTAHVLSVAFSPDGKLLASGGMDDDKVRLWDVATGKNIIALSAHRGRVPCVAFSPDGKTLASASWDKTIKLWDIKPPVAKK